jgi:hypothetical protein
LPFVPLNERENRKGLASGNTHGRPVKDNNTSSDSDQVTLNVERSVEDSQNIDIVVWF